MKTIGITGPSGSGKSLFSKKLTEIGIPCIDADKLYHDMLLPPSRCLDAISDAFGKELILPDGSLDRTDLSRRVFGDPDALERLNRTVLPLVLDEIRNTIGALALDGHTVVAVDAPTLIESGFNGECDLVIVITAPIQTRIKRIMERDAISEERARTRVFAQRNDDFYTSAADFTLINDGDEKSFEENAESIINQIKSLF